MQLLLITNIPEIASFAADNGVDQIMVDLEVLGKANRQGHLDTVMSAHSIEDVQRIRAVTKPGQLIVRTNPLHSGIGAELDAVIDAGADYVMLPYFHTPEQVADYIDLVSGRSQVILLAETKGAFESLGDCVAIDGVHRIHVGLNDLSLELGKRFMFELLADGTVERMAAILRSSGKPFGIGGIARIGEGALPAERIIVEHARLGSTAAILSRTFHRQAGSVAEIQAEMDFGREVRLLREAYATALTLSEQARRENALWVAKVSSAIGAAIPDRTAIRR